MSSRIPASIVALACLTVAPAARAADLIGSSVTLEGFAGWQSLNVGSPTSATASATQNNAIAGGDILFKASLFGLGLALDKALAGTVQPWDGSVMAGLVFDPLPSFRIEGLGEVGRRAVDFGDMFTSVGQTFLGLRPGVSFRLLPSPIRFGATALIRWRTSGPGADFGSPDYGFIGRLGIELP